MSRRVKSGIDWEIEEQANEILARGRDGVTKHSQKKDYLSPSQLLRRRQREVQTEQGYPEKSLYQGMFRRAYNPLIGQKKNARSDEE